MSWCHLLLLGIFPIAYAFSNDCPSAICGDMEIKFPFTLQSSSNSCRTAGLSANLSCSSTNETIITLPSSESYRVTSIGYSYELFIEVLLSTPSISCPWRNGLHLIVEGVTIGTSLVVFLIAVLVVLYFFKKYNNEKQKRIKVEKFLATYKSTTLTRYNFSNIKKITKKFNHKLGQGGFGSVYKDGTNRALVYEFMPNYSLEKFIFFGESKKRHEFFNMEKLQEIAIGIAQGINYLHQGCNQRILHFDIKPHNILLDYDFNPKISDFGLAKLCSRDQSIVTISAARGTMGYIAPEVYSRNFGPVSHKSDVYSYGMLLLEMIGRRKNIDPTIENLSEIYFPEWIYNKLVHNNSLGLAMEMEGNEEIMKRLAIIALWCIQWNPAERPSMNKVVQMLTTNFQSLEMPPTPFVPSEYLDGERRFDFAKTFNVINTLDKLE
ncbi:hypothetical protein KFK09_011662 [Dendrobium nobile]|uniref:Protein kinase domain-containing protein n=1 Tax=Dendrobium nobile TaxID=94219 RepID=A0A8T3BF73_DENNO|nr:hypothetical protein KFK09_011662 [Dendrobium nobile]